MSHNHHHTNEVNGSRLLTTMFLNFFITIIEIAGGLFSGSLSLLSDAFHNFSDGVAIIISYIAMKLSKKPRSLKYTFGLKRAEILAAVFNSSALIIISFFLIKEAFDRLYAPSQIKGSLMLFVAIGGLTANVIGTVLLKKDSDNNINLKAAYLHLLSDAISSLAVIIGAIFIIYFNVYWLDPVLTILISLYILKEAYEIVREALDIIMMSAPADIDVEYLSELVMLIPGIKNIHHVHLWKLNDTDIHFEAHVETDNILIGETNEMQKRVKQLLHDKFEITHVTLQFECNNCAVKELI
jgi:cobalt-zinc-cadmium efflux system protein